MDLGIAVRTHALQSRSKFCAEMRTDARAAERSQAKFSSRKSGTNSDGRGGDGCLRQDSHQPSQHRGALGALSSFVLTGPLLGRLASVIAVAQRHDTRS